MVWVCGRLGKLHLGKFLAHLLTHFGGAFVDLVAVQLIGKAMVEIPNNVVVPVQRMSVGVGLDSSQGNREPE